MRVDKNNTNFTGLLLGLDMRHKYINNSNYGQSLFTESEARWQICTYIRHMNSEVLSWSLIWNLAFYLVLGRVKPTTSTINVTYSIPPVDQSDSQFFQGPRWYLYLQPTGLEKPAVISQGLGVWSFLKISRNPPTSKISASSARTVQLSKSFLESVAGGTLRTCARVYTDTHTHTRRSHLYWMKYTKWELIKNQGKS